jgi:hypothetical protein
MADYIYLYDKSFLRAFDNENYKTQFIKITVLDFKTEVPIANIEGKATGGSCTFSGTSNARRAGNCSLIADDDGIKMAGYSTNQKYYNINDVNNLISINKKIRLETGFTNTLKKVFPQYDHYDTLWFPLGTYIIKTANISKNNSGVNISLTLADKSALINGDVGGVLPAGVILSEKEDYIVSPKGETQRVVEKLLIKDIIKYIMTEFGGEDPSNLLITDIPDSIVKVMKWIGQDPLYHIQTGTGTQKGNYFLLNTIDEATLVKEYSYGQDVCYLNEPFVYPGKLEANAGETVASVLDKIKNTLGNFEWFYDINGRFVFQEIKNYLNTSLSTNLLNLSENDYRVIPNLTASEYAFDRDNKKLLSSISNNPQYNNIKNDFVVWGNIKTTSGATKPIHYRLAFDTKPDVVNTINNPLQALVYIDATKNTAIIPLIAGNNYVLNAIPNKKTSDKEKYYLYSVAGETKYRVYRWYEEEEDFIWDKNIEYCKLAIEADDWRTQLYFNGLWADKQVFSEFPYAAELNAEWPKIYNVRKTAPKIEGQVYTYLGGYRDEVDFSNYSFWLDLIENTDFDVNKIGRRTKVDTGKDINCLIPIDVPNFVLVEADGYVEDEINESNSKGQEVVQVSSKVFNNLALGGGYNSAFDKIKELLYLHTNYNESISLSVAPIYHLQPNTRITVSDKETAIQGDYMIKSISIPLTPNGTSNISATKIVEKTF